MHKLFGRIAIAVGVVLSVIFFFEYNLAKIPNTYSFKRSCFEAQLDSIEVLILGNSKMYFGVNPQFFSQKAFNLANVSQTLFYDQAITLKYIDRMPKLKVVLVSISYTSFGEQLFDGAESWRDYFYYQFWDIEFSELPKQNIKRISKFYLYTPLTSVEYLFKGFKPSLINDVDKNGYRRIDTLGNLKNINLTNGQSKVSSHNNNFKVARVLEIRTSLSDFIAELKRRDITPIFIASPVHDAYYQYIDKVRESRNIELINEICTSFGCSYFNFIQDSRFVSGDFRDTDHLNVFGAKKFSLILNKEVLLKN